jgi:hypothetical protein
MLSIVHLPLQCCAVSTCRTSGILVLVRVLGHSRLFVALFLILFNTQLGSES